MSAVMEEEIKRWTARRTQRWTQWKVPPVPGAISWERAVVMAPVSARISCGTIRKA